MTGNSRQVLINEAQNGDIESFNLLFQDVYPKLYARALRYFGYGDEAKDALQDTFVKAFTKICQLKEPGKFDGWISRILSNECLLIKRDQRFYHCSIPCNEPEAIPSQESLIEQHTDKASLLQVLARLDDKKRMVLMLRYFSQFNSYGEIARILDIPVGTVRSRLAKARKALVDPLKHVSVTKSNPLNDLYYDEHVEMFTQVWEDLYSGHRERFRSIFDRDILVRFSSGGHARGIDRWAAEWEIDLITGVRFFPNSITNSGNISIVEGPIINPPDKPNHCPPEAGMVFFHHHGHVYQTHIHYAPRRTA